MRIFLLLFLLLLPVHVLAQSGQHTHTVRAGETLFSISRQYDVTIEQLRNWNNLPDNTLRVGQQLYITPDAPDDADSDMEMVADTTYHEVEAGQTLFRITRIYDVSPDDLREWNRLESDALSIGQELMIIRQRRGPSGTDVSADATPERQDPDDAPVAGDTVPTDDTTFADPDEPAYYEVRPGDTMYRIAARYNMSIDELMELNELEDTGLAVGQELRIRSRATPPPSVTAEWDMESSPQGKFVRHRVGEQDSIPELLQYHGMDLYDFRALNPGMSVSDVRSGDEITLLLAATTSRRNPYQVQASHDGTSQIQVSRYPGEKRGTTTTSGDLYNPESLTAAHPGLSLGTIIFVENPDNGRGVFVLINDRTSENRLLLSDQAFRSLQFTDATRLVVNIYENSDN